MTSCIQSETTKMGFPNLQVCLKNQHPTLGHNTRLNPTPYCRESKFQHPTSRVVGTPKYAPESPFPVYKNMIFHCFIWYCVCISYALYIKEKHNRLISNKECLGALWSRGHCMYHIYWGIHQWPTVQKLDTELLHNSLSASPPNACGM